MILYLQLFKNSDQHLQNDSNFTPKVLNAFIISCSTVAVGMPAAVMLLTTATWPISHAVGGEGAVVSIMLSAHFHTLCPLLLSK